MDRTSADLLRAIAMVMVVVIHGTDAWRLAPGMPASTEGWVCVVLDQLCRACVPLFLILSGMALAQRYPLGTPLALGDYATRRLSRLLIPYLVWSAVGIGCTAAIAMGYWGKAVAGAWADIVGQHRAEGPWWSAALWLILTGGAKYHLYYLPIAIACAACFPWLRRLPANAMTVGLVAAWLAGVLAWQQACRHVPGLPAPSPWSVAPWLWLPYLIIGCWIGRHGPDLAARVGRMPGWTMIALVASGPALCLLSWWAEVRSGTPGEFAGAFDRPAAAWAALTCCLAGLRWTPGPRLAAWAAWTSGISFAVYLSHPFVLEAVQWTGLKEAIWRPLWTAVALALSGCAGWLLCWIGARWTAMGWVIGR